MRFLWTKPDLSHWDGERRDEKPWICRPGSTSLPLGYWWSWVCDSKCGSLCHSRHTAGEDPRCRPSCTFDSTWRQVKTEEHPLISSLPSPVWIFFPPHQLLTTFMMERSQAMDFCSCWMHMASWAALRTSVRAFLHTFIPWATSSSPLERNTQGRQRGWWAT